MVNLQKRDLGKTVDRLLILDPKLGPVLEPIKEKWKKYPRKSVLYWQQLVEALNTKELLAHPQRTAIKNIVVPKRRPIKKNYTLEEVNSSDKVIGTLPEDLADKIRRYDIACINMAKLRTEVNLTKNTEMLSSLIKKEHLMEIQSKKIWFELKDHFDLWTFNGNLSIKRKNGAIVITSQPETHTPITSTMMPQTSQTPQIENNVGVLRLDPDLIRKLVKFLRHLEDEDGF